MPQISFRWRSRAPTVIWVRSGLTVALVFISIALAIAGISRAESGHPIKGQPSAHATGPASPFAKTRQNVPESEVAIAISSAPSTRTTFMAKWGRVVGADGYRLDVSTDAQFHSFVQGYHDLDVGNATGRVVTGLKNGEVYFYRVRAYKGYARSAGSTVMTAQTAVGAGLVINPTFDSSITSDPNAGAIEAAITQAISIYESLFSDPITINIAFRYTTADDPCGSLGTAVARSCTWEYDEPWDTYINALRSDATTSNDATANASLPSTALSADVRVSSANGRAIGLPTAGNLFYNGADYDGTITLNASYSFQFTRPTNAGNYDAQTAVEHEIDEVMGLGSMLNRTAPNYRPQDLFAWSSPGVRNSSSSGTRYLSIDSGNTDIVDFNQNPHGDFGDWATNCQHVQDAFLCNQGQYFDVTFNSPEGINLDVIGYGLVIPRASITTPAAGSTFSSAVVSFSWTANGQGQGYWLRIGSSPGAGDIYDVYQGQNQSVTVSGLPTNGRTVYVLLFSLVNGTWQQDDGKTYTAFTRTLGTPAKGDFDSDKGADIIWQDNASGDRSIWFMNGPNYAGGVDLGIVPTDWQIVGTGDFNGDGYNDIVWENTSTGECSVWFMNGTNYAGGADIAQVPPQWRIMAIGDFNGDGNPDILWQNIATGQWSIWFMKNVSYIGGMDLGAVPLEWKIVATGDFNGDGHTDILWQDTSTGYCDIWFMNGTTHVGTSEFGPIPTQWQIAGTGDFNGDGKADILWENTFTGDRSIWLMNGPNYAGGVSLPTIPTNWDIRNH